MLVPAYTSGTIPRSASARSTPICANPLSPPPPRTSAMRLPTDVSGGRMKEDWRCMSVLPQRTNVVPASSRARGDINTDPASTRGGHRNGARPSATSDDRALLEVFVQAVQPDQRAADGDHRPGVISDDEAGEQGGAPDHHQGNRLAQPGSPLR